MASKFVSLFVFVVIIASSFSHYLAREQPEVISWDVYGYYLYLPAIFKYNDITDFEFTEEHLKEYPISGQIYQVHRFDENKAAPIYTIGMALIYSPSYFAADFVAKMTSYEDDSMSNPYQWSIIFCSWLYIAIGLYYVRKTLLRLGFSEMISCLAIVGIYFGTNYFHYACFEAGMPHLYLFTLYIALIYHTINWHEKPNTRDTIIIGVIISLLCLCRPSEVISLLIPLLYGITSFKTGVEKLELILANKFQVILLAFIGFSIVSIQIVFWKLGHDSFYFNGYQGHHFDFKQPHIMDGLFSFRKGWLLYTPLLVFSLLGLMFTRKHYRDLHFSFLLFTLLNIYIVFSWHMWWYASSFGSRAMVQSYPIFLITLAAFSSVLINKPKFRYPFYAFIALFILLNQFQDWQYRQGIIMKDETTSNYYFAAFFNTTIDKKLRKYIDSNEKRPENFISKTTLAAKSIAAEDQTVRPFSYGPSLSIPINQSNLGALKGQWLEIESQLMYEGNRFNAHQGAKLVMVVERAGKNVKWIGVRVQHMVDPDIQTVIKYDYQIPLSIQVGDVLECIMWNNGPDTVYMETLSLNLFTPD